MEEQTASQCALTDCARFLRNAMTHNVARGDKNLKTDEVGILKPPVAKQPDRSGRNSSTRGGGSHPVTEIGSLIFLVNPVEPTTAQVSTLCRDDGELERGALLECGHLGLEPRTGLLDRVLWMTPGHPGPYLRERLPRRLED